MGQSTDAIIGYGYCWSEEDCEVPWGDLEWDQLILQRRGTPDPRDRYYDDSHPDSEYTYDEFREKYKDEIEAYVQARAAVKAEFSIEVGSHCSVDFPMPYIAVQGTSMTAWRGSPQDLTELLNLNVLDNHARALEALKKFVDEFELDTSGAIGPCWFLCSDWG